MNGDISRGGPSLKKEMVERAKPTMIRMIGKMVSTARVLRSLIYIRNLFLRRAQKCRKKNDLSLSFEIE